MSVATAFTPGTRVRDIGSGRTGTVLPGTAKYHPGFIYVQWDGDDSWYTSPHILETIR